MVPDPGGTPEHDPGAAVHQFNIVLDEFEQVAREELSASHRPDRWCRAIARVLLVDGAALSLQVGPDLSAPVGTSDSAAATGEAVQFTVREGPCVSAAATGRPAHIVDVRVQAADAGMSWPHYSAQLLRLTDFRSASAYPLLMAGTAVGSLNLYRLAAGPTVRLHEATELAAHVSGHLLPTLMTADSGGDDLEWPTGSSASGRRQVWLAQGMVVQANTDITAGQALDLLRASAFSADRTVDDLAADIIAGVLPVPVLQ